MSYQDQPCNIMSCLPMGASLEPSETSNSSTWIEFTIAGTTYQAEKGMTWAEWVESEYNPGDFYIYDYINDFIHYQSAHNTIYLDRTNSVNSDDIIIEGYSYRIVGGSSN